MTERKQMCSNVIYGAEMFLVNDVTVQCFWQNLTKTYSKNHGLFLEKVVDMTVEHAELLKRRCCY